MLIDSFDERFAFKESDLNPTILAATAIKSVGDLDRTPQTNGNNYLAIARLLLLHENKMADFEHRQ